MSSKNKSVKITENQLVELIDKIVGEVVDAKKVEWIAEQKVKNEAILEGKITELTKKVNEITEAKTGK